MTIKQYKKLARANAKATGTSHQAELDAIAREHGHSSWGPFQALIRQKEAREICSVRSFVDSLGADEETLVLVEDALHGYLAENGAGIGEYVESYEFRGEGGDILPDEDQQIYIKLAIARYIRKLDSVRRTEQTEGLGRAIDAVREIGSGLPRLARVPVLPDAPIPSAPFRIASLDLPRIRPVEPYSPPTSHLKPVDITRHDLPKIERVETPQERDRRMEEDYLRTKAKMDMLQQKLEEHRSRRDDDTE